MANQGRASYTIIDESKEKANVSMNVGIVTGASLPGLLTNLGTFKAALDAVIIGTVSDEALLVYDNPTGDAPPTDPYAQRENRWVVHYHDGTENFGLEPNNFFGRAYTASFACPDLSLKIAGTDLMNIATGAGATFKTEFQDAFLAPSGGIVVVDYIEYVGRKS